MDIKEIKSERVAEKYYKINHPSGLTIYVYPKDGYNSAYAIFGTRYGSINTKFPQMTAKQLPYLTVQRIILSINFLKAKTATHLFVMHKQVQMPMLIQVLKRPAIFFLVQKNLMKVLKFYLILFSHRILLRRPQLRNRVLSVRKSKCMMMHLTGE